jgi:cytoskeletal protein RodZ
LSELGQFLKKARTEKNISIEEVQEITKIRNRYIEAIEKGDYNVLPGQFYARAFIKSYAEAIGLNAEALLQQYENELPQVSNAPVEPIVRKRRRGVQPTSPKVGKWISRLVFYSFLFVVGFIIYYAFVNYMGEQGEETLDPNLNPEVVGDGIEEEDNPPTEPEQEPQTAPDPEPEEAPAPEPTWTFIETDGDTTIYEYANAEKLVVTLQATSGAVWYSLTNPLDGSNLEQGQVAQGEEKTWNLTEYEQVRFRFGNTRAVALLVNDAPMDLSELPNPNRAQNVLIHFKPLLRE